ncbi:MAG: hypothetical protein P0Y49_01185 [Candidatus Pedobacter colombiensis]|uniref:Uncharacterized protein n=1 Tax=Candidatus Pedobacter colombiensis TaxID=3121371 RepID=A0AAJ5W9I5_9SPHI|nr:hypothetical protein [Pedobacter sp.]WEK19768.1 MAG: hypothetical protein P0Y49_01185 [Pedobacter sp.]
MNYGQFCCYGNHVSSLTKQEIKNPLSVLEAIYKKRGLKSFKENLWHFFQSIYNDQQWRKAGAANFNRIYIDLIRLIDALWLIKTYQPELCVALHTPHLSIKTSGGLMNNFNTMLNCRQSIHKVPAKNNVKSFYKSRSLSFIKYNIQGYLQLALNASYMSGNKFTYFTLPEYNVVDDFLKLECLIEHGSSIYINHSNQKSRHCKAIKFATNTDHTTTLSKESIANPAAYIRGLYFYDLRFERVYESVKILEKSFYDKNFWVKADNPGNILFFTECLKQLIDCIWLLTRKDEIETAAKKRALSNGKKRRIVTLNKQELNHPFLAISNFFEHKKMHEWKKQVDEWTAICLSSTKTIKAKNKMETSENLKHLLKFIEASHLLTC